MLGIMVPEKGPYLVSWTLKMLGNIFPEKGTHLVSFPKCW